MGMNNAFRLRKGPVAKEYRPKRGKEDEGEEGHTKKKTRLVPNRENVFRMYSEKAFQLEICMFVFFFFFFSCVSSLMCPFEA